MTTAFEGVRVLEIGQIYNGPYCGLLMALLGAEVIKLEPPTGERLRYRSADGVEPHEFLMLNSDKRSIVVDIKTDEGREIFKDLIKNVDVVIENFAPGTMKRLGLDPEELMKLNPRLVYASGKGYGHEGPYAEMAAMDITVQAMSGTISTTGFPDGPPVKAGPAFIDFLGGIHLFGGIAAALFQRERTGEGQIVEVAMHDTVYPTLASVLGGIYNFPDRELPERTGNRHSGLAVAPYNVYKAADGWVAIISVAERHFEAVMRAAGREDLIGSTEYGDPLSRMVNMDSLDELLEQWTSTLDRWAIVEELAEGGVPCAPVLTAREVAEDKHLVERGMIREVTHPVRGQVPVPASPIRLHSSPVGEMTVAPSLGEGTDEILGELLGADPGRLDRLRKAGVIN